MKTCAGRVDPSLALELRMITIIIPTANRAAMLRTALRSIAQQSARDAIGTVIVSENGGSVASRAICAEFPQLPIRYVLREPPLSPLDHACALYEEARGLGALFVAVLHDDDWWGPSHLGNGLAQLHADPNASAYWSSSFFVWGERSWIKQCWSISIWAISGFGRLDEIVTLDYRKSVLAALCGAPAHYSTLIGRSEVVADAFREVAMTDNSYDNDRLLFHALARRGSVVVNLVPEVFVRHHPANEQLLFPPAEVMRQSRGATTALLSACRALGIDVKAELQRLYDDCPVKALRPAIAQMINVSVQDELRRQELLPAVYSAEEPRTAKWLVRQCCPPLVWEAAKSARAALFGSANGSSNGSPRESEQRG